MRIVANQWKLPEPDVVRPVRIPWLLVPFVGLAASWFPRRLGPHLAQTTWLAAILNAVVASIIVTGLLEGQFGLTDPSLLYRPVYLLRLSLIHFVWLLGYEQPGWLGFSYTILMQFVPGLLLIIGSVALWPSYAVGETHGMLMRRAAKLALWSMPTWVWIVVLQKQIAGRLDGDYNDGWLAWNLIVLGSLWYVHVLFALGDRYSGPRTGWRWAPFEPRCDQCGYNLVGIASDSNCPECGHPIRASLPDGRCVPAFAQSGWLLAVPRFVQTLAATTQVSFGSQCAVWQRQKQARNYFRWVCVAVGLIVTGTIGIRGGTILPYLYVPLVNGAPYTWGGGWNVYYSTYSTAGHPLTVWLIEPLLFGQLAFAALALLGWVLHWGLFLIDRRRASARMTILHYQSVWLLPATLVAAFVFLWMDPYASELESAAAQINGISLGFWLRMLSPAAGMVVLLFAGRHVIGQIRRAQYANA